MQSAVLATIDYLCPSVTVCYRHHHQNNSSYDHAVFTAGEDRSIWLFPHG